jgi:glycosyltransferase involved in cell wall biosynthesis
MFTLLTEKNAASRVFCYQYAPRFRAAGVHTAVFSPSPLRIFELLCERRRLVAPLKALYWYGIVLPVRLLQIPRAWRYDVIFIQRGIFRYNASPLLESLLCFGARRLHGARVVYHIDDALYLHADPRHFQRRFAMADVVLTGNGDLADYARRWNANVMTFEGALDLAYYIPAERREGAPVVIGWTGTDPTTIANMPAVMARLPRDLDVRLRIVGTESARRVCGPRIEHRRWSLVREVENLRSFDIGIMPLEETEYNRAKEGFKLKQYMAVGIPVVASPVGKNLELVQDGVNGLFARSEQEWAEKLALLARDPELRQRMGAAGRRFVEERYSLDAATPRLLEILRGVMATRARAKGAGD